MPIAVKVPILPELGSTRPIDALSPAPWHDRLKEIQSLGKASKKATSLGELHAARETHMGQFFTPTSIASLMWQLAEPAIQQISRKRLVNIMDNSIGNGRLVQFANPELHRIYGCDVHKECIEPLIEALNAGGISGEIIHCGMESVFASDIDIALINPPFSVHLESPNLQPYACTSFGRFGPCTSAKSHEYALAQALDAAQVVVALLPRSYAAQVMADEELHQGRLKAVFHLPQSAFKDEGANVYTSIMVFDGVPAGHNPSVVTLDRTPDALPAINYRTPFRDHVKPRFRCVGLTDDGPSIVLPVTGDKRVRVFRAGRSIRLEFRCGLVQAQVVNAILIDRVMVIEGGDFRYPRDVKWIGQGALDVQFLLANDDPVYEFQRRIIDVIESFDAKAEIDPGLIPYIRKQKRRLGRNMVPFRRIAFVKNGKTTHGLPTTGSFNVTCKATENINPLVWGSPIIREGQELVVDVIGDETRVLYRLNGPNKVIIDLTAENLIKRFHYVSPMTDGWTEVCEGRFGKFPDIESKLRQRASELGLDQWLWDYQYEDLIELAIGRGKGVAGWEMGLGKSRLGVALILLAGGANNLLVSEANLVYELANELKKLPVAKDLWQIIESPADLKSLRKINLISYSRLRMALNEAKPKLTYAKALRRRVHTLVADEIHNAANQDSQQTMALWTVSPKVRYGMSGTPIPNYPRNLLPILQFIAGESTPLQPYGQKLALCRSSNINSMSAVPRGVDAFRDEFVTTEWVTNQFAENLNAGAKREIPRIANVVGYRDWASRMIKRRLRLEPECQKHVKVQDPHRAVHTLEWDRQHLAHYLTIADQFAGWFRNHRRDCQVKGLQLNLMLLLRRIQEVQFALSYPQEFREGPSIYRGGLTTKQSFVVDHLNEIAAGGERAICFAHSPSVLQLLHQELNGWGVESLVLTGQTEPKKRMQLLDEKFRNGAASVLLMTYKANRNGQNIPQANRVVLYDRDWTPKTEEQAIGRTLRPEQLREVTADYVHIEGSLDEYMAQVVEMKRNANGAGLDWGEQDETTEFLHLDTIIGRFVEDLAKMHGMKSHEFRKELANVA